MALLLGAAAGAGTMTVGCGARPQKPAYEYMPDMARGPAYKAYAPNPATRDGLTLQAPVPGTIARGQRPFHYGRDEKEAIRAGNELHPPMPVTARTLREGEELYQTYCAVCHGAKGKGDGPLAGKIPPPPAYTSTRVLDFSPGRLFHVITMGSGKMGSYAGQLSPGERWKVVAFVRTSLQGRDDFNSQQAAKGP